MKSDGVTIKASDVVKAMTIKINVEGLRSLRLKMWICGLMARAMMKIVGCKVELVGDNEDKPRIFLYPGIVTSITGTGHTLVSARRLAHLYGVELKDCIVISGRDAAQRGSIRTREGDIHLMPREDGMYNDVPLS